MKIMNYYKEKKKSGWLAVVVVVFLSALIWFGISCIPPKAYHCHKNGYLFESMNDAKNIFTKTDIKCIRIDNIKENK